MLSTRIIANWFAKLRQGMRCLDNPVREDALTGRAGVCIHFEVEQRQFLPHDEEVAAICRKV